MFSKRPRIDHLAPNVLRGEWLELVGGDDEVGKETFCDRVEGGVDAAERIDDVATLLQVLAHC